MDFGKQVKEETFSAKKSFGNQVKERKIFDQKSFEDACVNVSSAVLSEKIINKMKDDSQIIQNSLSLILKFYHLKATEIPSDITDYREQMEYMLRPHSMAYRIVKLDKGWYKNAIGAMIASKKDDDSVVALIPIGYVGYFYIDYKTGKRIKVTKKNAELFDEEAYYFYKPFPMEKLSVGKIFRYLITALSYGDYLRIILSTLAVSLLGMFSPRVSNFVFGVLIPSGSSQEALALFVFLICLSISTLIISILKSIVSANIQTKLQLSIPGASMMRLLNLPVKFFRTYTVGELFTQLSNVTSLCNLLVSTLLSTGLTTVFSLVYFAQIFKYASNLVAPAVIVVLITIAFSTISTIGQIKLSKKSLELSSKESTFSLSMISGIQKIKLTGSEKRMFSRWANIYADKAKLAYKPPMYLRINPIIITAISSIGTLVLYYIAVTTKVSVADYMSFNAAFGMLAGSFSSLAGAALSFAQIKPILEKIKPMLEEIPEVEVDKKVVTSLEGKITLKNVSFRYQDDLPWVVNDLSIDIDPGDYVAIVGKTGCGKSTLIRLLLGFEKQQKGTIYFDDRDMSTLNVKSLRKKIGVVLQDDKLFTGDIFSNISITNPDLTMNEAWEILRMVDLEDVVKEMPMELHTLISEGSGGISGGQRQRLVMARAIAQKPSILIFDEATSALDNITQKKVSESLDKLNCTRVVIAHRLSTIQHCNKIIVLDGGKVLESGTYDELIEKKGFFAELVERQRLDGSD